MGGGGPAKWPGRTLLSAWGGSCSLTWCSGRRRDRPTTCWPGWTRHWAYVPNCALPPSREVAQRCFNLQCAPKSPQCPRTAERVTTATYHRRPAAAQGSGRRNGSGLNNMTNLRIHRRAMVATAACGLGSRYEAPNQPWRARAWSPQPLTSMAPQWLLTAAGHRGRRQRPNLTLAQWARGAATGGPDCVESTEVPGRRCR